jgi:ATP-dependent Lhr-like helicase
MLKYLINTNYIQKTEQSKLVISLAGEKIVNRFQFYAVFADTQDYVVKQGGTGIRSIFIPLYVGNQFA